ncbi:MAG TPA: hypothetical protein VIL49_04650 [Capillimicrobium sp.]|jgi:hypothetical protein
MPRRALTLALMAALAVAGCGTEDDRAQAADVVGAFYAALEAGDGARACAQLSAPAVEALESQAGAPCAEAVTALDVRPGALGATEVYVTNAKVDASSGESTFLSREADGWRISAAGCAPEDGKPADRPFACEVEA